MLGRKWGSLYVLSILSVGTVVLLILLLNRARLDAARHKEAEQQLRAGEERLSSVLTTVPDLILVLTADGRYREIYTADDELLVGSRDDLLGRSIHERTLSTKPAVSEAPSRCSEVPPPGLPVSGNTETAPALMTPGRPASTGMSSS